MRTLESWSARYRWQDRITEIDRKAGEEAEREHLEWVRLHRERLRQEGLLLSDRGIEWLKEKAATEVSASEAIRAIDTGFKLEAMALGEATQRISIEEADNERIQRLTEEELQLIIRQARESKSGGAKGEGEASPA